MVPARRRARGVYGGYTAQAAPHGLQHGTGSRAVRAGAGNETGSPQKARQTQGRPSKRSELPAVSSMPSVSSGGCVQNRAATSTSSGESGISHARTRRYRYSATASKSGRYGDCPASSRRRSRRYRRCRATAKLSKNTFARHARRHTGAHNAQRAKNMKEMHALGAHFGP